MIFENFNLKTFKFETDRVRQNVKYRVAELTEFNTKLFKEAVINDKVT